MAAGVEHSGLVISDVEILRLHYAKTLRAWRERFLANWDKAAAIRDERFCRMWEFYLAASEAAFRYQGLVVFQMQLVRRIDALPHHPRLHVHRRASPAGARPHHPAPADGRRVAADLVIPEFAAANMRDPNCQRAALRPESRLSRRVRPG